MGRRLFCGFLDDELVCVTEAGLLVANFAAASEADAMAMFNSEDIRGEVLEISGTPSPMEWVPAADLPEITGRFDPSFKPDAKDATEAARAVARSLGTTTAPEPEIGQQEPTMEATEAPEPGPQTANEPQKEEPEVVYRDVEVKLGSVNETLNRIIFDLEQNDFAIETEQQQHKDRMKDLNKKQELIKAQLYEARAGRVMTTVECFIKLDYEAGEKLVVRKDTGEVLESMPIPEAELQVKADVEPAAGEKIAEEFELTVAKDTASKFDVMKEDGWAAIKPNKLKKGDRFRIYRKADDVMEPLEKDGTTSFVCSANAKTSRKTKETAIKAIPYFGA